MAPQKMQCSVLLNLHFFWFMGDFFFNQPFTRAMKSSRGCWGKEKRRDTHHRRQMPRNGLKGNTELFPFNTLTRAKTHSHTFIN